MPWGGLALDEIVVAEGLIRTANSQCKRPYENRVCKIESSLVRD